MNLVDKIKADVETLARHRGYSFQTDFDAVGEFHRKFGLPVSGGGRAPRELTEDEAAFRLQFLAEELMEFADALGFRMRVEYERVPGERQDVAKAFDSLLDLNYVSCGTAHMGGWPWAEGMAEVQRANMSKVRANADGSNSTRGSGLDVVKPEGFKPPNILEVLMRAGWNGPRLPIDQPLCELCKQPMPPGEEMFKFHGYSGPCPEVAIKPIEEIRPFFDEKGHIPGAGQ